MLYSYITLDNDRTEITYGKPYTENGLLCINVEVETATDNSFISVDLKMPYATVIERVGMTDEQVNYWTEFIKRHYKVIQKFALREIEREKRRETRKIKKNATNI
jgi:hypothetical protein